MVFGKGYSRHAQLDDDDWGAGYPTDVSHGSEPSDISKWDKHRRIHQLQEMSHSEVPLEAIRDPLDLAAHGAVDCPRRNRSRDVLADYANGCCHPSHFSHHYPGELPLVQPDGRHDGSHASRSSRCGSRTGRRSVGGVRGATRAEREVASATVQAAGVVERGTANPLQVMRAPRSRSLYHPSRLRPKLRGAMRPHVDWRS